MNNMSSYCGLVDAKIRASDKDIPVLSMKINMILYVNCDDTYVLVNLQYNQILLIYNIFRQNMVKQTIV